MHKLILCVLLLKLMIEEYRLAIRNKIVLCNVCKLNYDKTIRLGRIAICDECLISASDFYKEHSHEKFEIIFHADMSLRIFRRTFPDIYKIEGFSDRLKTLKSNIDILEEKVSCLSEKESIYKPINNIVKELNLLYSLYV